MAAEPTRPPKSAAESITFELIGLQVLAVATHLYFFAVGATIGSFLNVVVYRLPRGLGVVYPASRCPRCLTPIRMRDNIPVWSWLRLRGRCRACDEPISPRYLLVELGVGLIFWGLLMAEVVPGGRNLPLRQPAFHRGVIWTVWSLDWGLLGIYGYHCVLLCVLVCLGLIRYDRMPAPRRLLAFGLGAGLGLPLAWPALRPVPWSLVAEGSARGAAGALVDGLAGIAAGIVAAGALCLTLRDRRASAGEVWATLGSAAIIGAFLGWQAAISVGLLAAIGALALALLARLWPAFARVPLSGAVGLATLVQIPAWRALATWSWWPGPEGRALPMVGAVCATMSLAWLAGCLRPELPSTPDGFEESLPEAPPGAAHELPDEAGAAGATPAGWVKRGEPTDD
jgi:leader peptidase (prepilin peptidase)/N-methyltransferase